MTQQRTGIELSVSGKSPGQARRQSEGRAARVIVIGRWDGGVASGQVRPPEDRVGRPVRVSLDTLEAQLDALAPTVPTAIGPVSLRSIEALHPDELVQHVPLLQQLMNLRRQLRDPAQFEAAARVVSAWQGAPAAPAAAAAKPASSAAATNDIERLLGRPASAPAAPSAQAEIDRWVADAVRPHLAPQAPAHSEALIGVVNQALTAALTRLLHDPRWQAAEALWRGVDWLLRQVGDEQLDHLSLVDLSWAELSGDLLEGRVPDSLRVALQVRADDDEAPLLTHVLIHDQIQLDPLGIASLGALAQPLGQMGAQLVACPALGQFFDRGGVLQADTQAAWDACRREAGDALAMVAPRFVLRQPYGPGSDPLSWLDYSEPLASERGDAILWGNAGWLTLSNELNDGPGTVADLPHVLSQDPDGGGAKLITTEWALTQALADMLSQFGVLPVIGHASRPMVRLG